MATVHYKAANVRGLGSDFILKPGKNEVPDEVLAKWAEHEQIAPLIKDGTIEIEDKPKAKRGPKAKADKAEGEDKAEPSEDEISKALGGEVAK